MGSCQSSSNGGTEEDLLVQRKKKERQEMIQTMKTVGVAVGVVAGLALVGWGISKLGSSSSSSSGSKRKMMKAPGREIYIYRDVFESNPAGYFRDNR
ncbi:hypothetical protein ACSBR1_006458 [Camellia fascicularis]